MTYRQRALRSAVAGVLVGAVSSPTMAFDELNVGSVATRLSQPVTPNAAPPQPQLIRGKKPVRRPLIDLKRQAGEKRDGQIVPGDAAVPLPAAEPAAPAPLAVVEPPVTAPAPPAVVRPSPIREEPAESERPGSTPPSPPPPPAEVQPTPVTPAPAPAPAQVPADIVSQRPAAAGTHQDTPSPPASAEPAPQPPTPAPPMMEPAARLEAAPPVTIAAPEVVAQPARLRLTGVEGLIDLVQWRSISEAWRPVRVGDELDAMCEVRTGLGVRARIEVDDQYEVLVDRLSRVRLGRQVVRTPEGSVRAVFIEVLRGGIDLKPLQPDDLGRAMLQARIKTPDQSWSTRVGVHASYDPFTGTTTRPVETHP